MGLDLRTASFFVSLISILAAVALILFARLAPRYRGVDYWAVAGACAALGSSLLALRDLAPGFFTIVASNTLIVASLYLILVGTAMFTERPHRLVRTRIALVLAFAIFVYLTYVQDNMDARTILFSIVVTPLAGVTAYWILSTATPSVRLSYRFAAILFASFAAFNLVRGILFLVPHVAAGLFETTLIQTWTFLVAAIFVPLWTMAAVAMVTQRNSVDLQYDATVDHLTQMLNRGAGQARIDQQVALAERTGRPFSILIIDIDNFKEINDRWGHAVGDAVVRAIGPALWEHVRLEDVVCRWGGDEFLLLLVDSTSAGSLAPHSVSLRGLASAERVCRSIASRTFARKTGEEGAGSAGPYTIKTTLSIGVATYHPGSGGVEATIADADAAMHEAKRMGGNQAVAAPERVGAALN